MKMREWTFLACHLIHNQVENVCKCSLTSNYYNLVPFSDLLYNFVQVDWYQAYFLKYAIRRPIWLDVFTFLLISCMCYLFCAEKTASRQSTDYCSHIWQAIIAIKCAEEKYSLHASFISRRSTDLHTVAVCGIQMKQTTVALSHDFSLSLSLIKSCRATWEMLPQSFKH